MHGFDFSTLQWILFAVCAMLVGMSKVGVPGVSMLVVPALAIVFGGKASAGILLPRITSYNVCYTKLLRTYIFPGNRPPVKNGLLICKDDGAVVDLLEREENWKEEAGVEYYSGVIVPGFVNAHCHLELSHLHKQLEANRITSYNVCYTKLLR